MLGEIIRHPILSARFIAKRIREIPAKGLPKLSKAESDDFDRKYGVETAKTVQIVPTSSPNFVHGVRYSASGESIIRWCIENCGMPYSETTFVDVGCGKGRVLIVATMYPFRRIVGVEYSPQLAAICRQNLDKLNISQKCELNVRDAVDFVFPKENLLVFLYNPFDSTILKNVLTRLAAIRQTVRIAHLGPGHDVIQQSGLARIVCSGEGPTIYEMLKPERGPA